MLDVLKVYTGMVKVLWYGDACCNTGFGRVTHSVLDALHKKHDVSVLGVNYLGDPHSHPYEIFPAATIAAPDRFGLQRITEVVTKVNPDVFICLNDIWVANQVWEKFQFVKDQTKCKFVVYFPTDSQAYYPDMLQGMKHWDVPVTFTQGSGNRILSHPGIGLERLAVIPHGVDTGRFYPMDMKQARDDLGIPQDKFIVFNGNRNQPRKRIDLTIEAFAEFAIDKPDTMLYLHMGTKDLGWDIIPLFERAMRSRGLEHDKRLMLTANAINYSMAPPDELLNKIYNAVNVGVNTADGEGWGLVSFEHASCKKPQLVPAHTVCKDLWEEAGELAEVAEWVTDKDLGVKRGIVSVDSVAEKLTNLYNNERLYRDCAEACYALTQRPEYRWENVANGFDSLINSLVA